MRGLHTAHDGGARITWAFAVLLYVCVLGYAESTVRSSASLTTVIAQVLLSVVGFAGACFAWRRDGRATLLAIVVAGLCARAVLLPLDPTHSNDVYRYLWDGRDLLHGIDPYVAVPSGPALASLRANDWLYAHIDWTDVPTLYPPLDLALYTLAARIDVRHLYAIKGVLVLGDVLTMWILALGLRRARLPIGRLAVYAWNPIVLTEFAQGGHEEAWAIAFIVAALVALRAERPTLSALSLAAAALTKLYPVAFVPVFFASRRTWHAATLAAAVITLAYLPFFLWADNALGFLHSFANDYRFNDSLHEAIGTTGAIVVFGCTVACAIVARRRDARLAGLIFILELAYLACSPNVYPWYTAIFPALVPLVPFAMRGAWRPLTLGALCWSALTPLAYLDRWVFDQGSAPDDVVHVLEYVPLYAGIVAALYVLAVRERARTAAAVRGALVSLAPRARPRASLADAAAVDRIVLEPRVELGLDALPNGPRERARERGP